MAISRYDRFGTDLKSALDNLGIGSVLLIDSVQDNFFVAVATISNIVSQGSTFYVFDVATQGSFGNGVDQTPIYFDTIPAPNTFAGGDKGLKNISPTNTNPSAVSATYQFGSPFVWLYDRFDPLGDAEVTALNYWWGGYQLSSWVKEALMPEVSGKFVSAGGGTYANSNYKVSSLSATTVSATTYQGLDPTLQTLANQLTASNVLLYFSGVDAAASSLYTSAGRKFAGCSSTLAAGDVFYVDSNLNIVKLAKPTNIAVLVFDPYTNQPIWVEGSPDATTKTLYSDNNYIYFN